jgi:hypothetical protein
VQLRLPLPEPTGAPRPAGSVPTTLGRVGGTTLGIFGVITMILGALVNEKTRREQGYEQIGPFRVYDIRRLPPLPEGTIIRGFGVGEGNRTIIGGRAVPIS